jgi:uncharacterized protein (DUF1330 family)
MLISKNRVYELALSSIKAEHVNDFLQQYIPSVFPILTEYGGKFLINRIIQNSITNKYPAKSFAILEWPSIDQFAKINTDKRMVPLMEARNQYLDFIIEGCFYCVLKDTELRIPQNKTMTIFLSNRTVLGDQNFRFHWINDRENRDLSLNLYFSNRSMNTFNQGKDI